MKLKRINLVAVAASVALIVGAQNALAQDYTMNGKPVTKEMAQAVDLCNKSMETLENGNLTEATRLAEEALKLAPDFYYTLTAVGICQARSGRSDEAIASFKKSLAKFPDQPDTLWSLAATLQSAGRSSEAVSMFKDYVSKYPTNPRTAQGKAFIDLMAKQGPSKAADPNAPDYYAEAIGDTPLRWSKGNIPIKIYIKSGQGVSRYKDSYADQLKLAMKNWEDASNGKVKFEIVDAPDKAQIRFYWSDNPSDVSNPAEGGEALLKPIGNTLANVKITVLTIDTPGIKMNDQLVRLVCTHELGHALGIAGHSSSPHDIMYSSLALDWEHSKISERDARTLERLYSVDVATIPHASLNSQDMLSASDINNSSEIVEISNRAGAAFNEKNYEKAAAILRDGISKFPDSSALKRNLGTALNNAGLMAMEATQFGKALSMFQEALVLNPQSKAVQHNIATVHYNMGLNSMRSAKFSEAEPELKIAIEKCEALSYQPLLQKAATEYATTLKRLGKTEALKQIESKYKVTAN